MLAVVALITADLRFNSLQTTRSVLELAATPVYWVADLPSRIGDWNDTNLVSRADLLEENARLKRENLVLEGRSHQMASLQAENVRLRALLNSSALLRDDVLVAELIGVSPDPVRHQLVLNKGSNDGVFVGQPLIDADGLMGQIVAFPFSPSLFSPLSSFFVFLCTFPFSSLLHVSVNPPPSHDLYDFLSIVHFDVIIILSFVCFPFFFSSLRSSRLGSA